MIRRAALGTPRRSASELINIPADLLDLLTEVPDRVLGQTCPLELDDRVRPAFVNAEKILQRGDRLNTVGRGGDRVDHVAPTPEGEIQALQLGKPFTGHPDLLGVLLGAELWAFGAHGDSVAAIDEAHGPGTTPQVLDSRPAPRRTSARIQRGHPLRAGERRTPPDSARSPPTGRSPRQSMIGQVLGQYPRWDSNPHCDPFKGNRPACRSWLLTCADAGAEGRAGQTSARIRREDSQSLLWPAVGTAS